MVEGEYMFSLVSTDARRWLATQRITYLEEGEWVRAGSVKAGRFTKCRKQTPVTPRNSSIRRVRGGGGVRAITATSCRRKSTNSRTVVAQTTWAPTCGRSDTFGGASPQILISTPVQQSAV